MNKNVEIAIIGGGIIGMATAYNLCLQGIKPLVIEREYIGSGSTSRCIAGLRHQFSTPPSIRVMKESIGLFSRMEDELGVPVEFHQGGYLLLAHNPELVDVFKSNIKTQKAEGVDVTLLTPEEAQKVVPDLNCDGLLAAAYCPHDAQAYPFAVLNGYKKKIDAAGGEFFLNNPVVSFEKKTNFILHLEKGETIEAEKVLLCAGPWTGDLAKIVGLDLPLYPERHEAMITERIPRFFEPMIVDYRPDGCYFQQLLTGQIIGCFTPVPNVPGKRKDSSFEFLPQLAGRMVRLLPRLKTATILRHWAGSYTMTPDGNPIVDETEIENLFVGSGMSGHGFMLGPALGKYLAHRMVHGTWGVDIDFGEFALKRSYEGKEKLK